MLRTTYPLLLLLLVACSPARRVERENRTLAQFQQQEKKPTFLKAHMKNGEVYVFDRYMVDGAGLFVQGNGVHLDVNRKVIRKTDPANNLAPFTVNTVDVALFETNDANIGPNVLAMALVTGASVGMTAFCIINPKACFGSCPTFYARNGDTMVLQAEGFSSSIARSLEKKDVDMLYLTRPEGPEVTIRMTNEALETHINRHVDLLALPKSLGNRVFATAEGVFYPSNRQLPPLRAEAAEGDITPLVAAFDQQERYSMADEKNLIKKETIALTFAQVPAGEYGLVVGSRQTLLTTFLFYQGLGYLGHTAGQAWAKLESGNPFMQRRTLKLFELLGGIKVEWQNERGRWLEVTGLDEMGPIATDVQLVKLPRLPNRPVKLRLTMTQGLWRLNYLALAQLESPLLPVRLQPYEVRNAEGGLDEEARRKLTDDTQTLVTLPGEAYTFKYRLPDPHQDYELFLESKG
jgi:hypothetical protein